MPSMLTILSLIVPFVVGVTRKQSGTIQQTHTETIDCSGDCVCTSAVLNTTCILNCDGKDRCKDSTLKCSTGSECIINCIGDSSCGGNGKFDASGATDVSISCTGTDACKGNTIIDCGTGHCTISCDLVTSCIDATVYADNAKSLQCIGECDSFASIPAPFTSPTAPPVPYGMNNNATTDPGTATSLWSVNYESEESVLANMSPDSGPIMWYVIIASIVIITVMCSVTFCGKMFCKGKQTDSGSDGKSTDSVPTVPKRAVPTKQTYSGTKPKLPPRSLKNIYGNDGENDENEMKISVENGH